MSHGNVEGKLVSPHFWQSCANCRFVAACQVRPRHPAYPHTWHWGREFVSFPEGELIVKSWVGTIAIGQPHTGCQQYEVAPTDVMEPQAHHRRYLTLEQERQTLDVTLDQLEHGGLRSTEARHRYHQLMGRFLEILAEQRALTAAAQAQMDTTA